MPDFPEASQFKLIADGIRAGRIGGPHIVRFPDNYGQLRGDIPDVATLEAIRGFVVALAESKLLGIPLDTPKRREGLVQEICREIRGGDLTRAKLDEFISGLG